MLWVGALQIVLDKGQQEDWLSSGFIRIFVALTGAGLLAFLVRELMTSEPVVKLSIMKDRTYSTGIFLMTVLGFVLYGSMVLLPVWLQTLMGYPSLQAGIAMAPRGMGAMLGMPFVGIILGYFDPRKILMTGLTVGAGTLYAFSRLNLEAGYWDFFWIQFVQGISLSLLFVPLTTITMSQISRSEMGNATSLFSLMRNMGGGIGIAMVTTIYARNTQMNVNRLGSNVTPFHPAAVAMLENLRAMWMGRGSGPGLADQQAVATMFGMVQRQAAMVAFVQSFVLLALMFLAVIPLVLIMKRPPRGAKAGAGH